MLNSNIYIYIYIMYCMCYVCNKNNSGYFASKVSLVYSSCKLTFNVLTFWSSCLSKHLYKIILDFRRLGFVFWLQPVRSLLSVQHHQPEINGEVTYPLVLFFCSSWEAEDPFLCLLILLPRRRLQNNNIDWSPINQSWGQINSVQPVWHLLSDMSGIPPPWLKNFRFRPIVKGLQQPLTAEAGSLRQQNAVVINFVKTLRAVLLELS